MLYDQRNCWKVYVLTVYISGRVIFCQYSNEQAQKHQSKSGGSTIGEPIGPQKWGGGSSLAAQWEFTPTLYIRIGREI